MRCRCTVSENDCAHGHTCTVDLNCASLVRHNTLIITLDALRTIEQRMLRVWHTARTDLSYRYIHHKDRILAEATEEFDPDADEQPPFV